MKCFSMVGFCIEMQNPDKQCLSGLKTKTKPIQLNYLV